MDQNKSTHEFVEDLHERQEKDRKNKVRQSKKGQQGEKLPNNEH